MLCESCHDDQRYFTLYSGKSPEEIRQQFGIVNDFTPEEEAQIREENKWAEECTN